MSVTGKSATKTFHIPGSTYFFVYIYSFFSFDGEEVQKLRSSHFDHKETSFANIKDEILVAVGVKVKKYFIRNLLIGGYLQFK